MQPDVRLRESLRYGFEREGMRVASCGRGDSFEPALFAEPAQLVIAGGRTGEEARSVMAQVRGALAAAARRPPVLYVGNGIARSQALAEGAAEYLGKPVFVRDTVTVARLLAARKAENPDTLSGDLGEHFGLFYLVRAISALERRGVLTVVRGMRRGELRFFDGEVTSAQVGPLHGLAALHQLLLWTEGRFELRPEDVVRRQQIPLQPAELFADAERFLSEIVSVAGDLSPSACYEVDETQIARVDGRIPPEVSAVLKLFDGTRTVADVVEDCQFRVFETLRIANRLSEIGLIRLCPTSNGRQAQAPEPEPELQAEPQGEARGEIEESGDRAARGPGYVVVSKSGRADGGHGAGGPPIAGSIRQTGLSAIARRKKGRRRGRGQPGPAQTRSNEGASARPAVAPQPSSAAAPARVEPLVVDWAQVLPGAIGSELATSPVVPSSAAAGEISVIERGAQTPMPVKLEVRRAEDRPAETTAEVGVAATAATEPHTANSDAGDDIDGDEEPILLTKKIRPGQVAARSEAVPDAPGRPAADAVREAVREAVLDDMSDAITAPVSAPRRSAPESAQPAVKTSAAPQARSAPAKSASAKSARAPSHPRFSAAEEAFFAEGKELSARDEDSFDDLDEGYLPQGFWRRLFRGPKRR